MPPLMYSPLARLYNYPPMSQNHQTCTICGATNPIEAQACGICGGTLSVSTTVVRDAGQEAKQPPRFYQFEMGEDDLMITRASGGVVLALLLVIVGIIGVIGIFFFATQSDDEPVTATAIPSETPTPNLTASVLALTPQPTTNCYAIPHTPTTIANSNSTANRYAHRKPLHTVRRAGRYAI